MNLKKAGLIKRLTLSIASICIVLSLFIECTLFIFIKNRMEPVVTNSIQTVISNNAQNVSDLFFRIDLALRLIAGNESNVLELLSSYENNLISDMKTYQEAQKVITNYIRIALEDALPIYKAAFFVNEDMPLVKMFPNSTEATDASLQNNSVLLYNDNGVKNKKWYQEACNSSGQEYFFSMPNQEDILYIAKELNQNVNLNGSIDHKTLGIILIGLDLSNISDRLNFQKLTEQSVVLLSERTGKILYSNETELKGKGLSECYSAESASGEQAENIVEGIYQGQKALIQTIPTSLNLNITTIVPVYDIHSMVYQSVASTAVVALALIICGMFMIVFVSYRIIKPIKKLSEYMSRKNVMPIECDLGKNDEISILYNSYNDMLRRIAQLINEIEEREKQKRKDQFSLLQAQINPHFIYNTLDSVCCMALIKGEDGLAQVLSSLATIIRYNISGIEEVVTINDEIKMIEEYISIEKIRWGERIHFSCEIQEECKNVILPKMTIQPLVENSIFYGVNINETQLTINIYIYKKEDTVFIEVADSGKNADIEDLNAMMTGKNQINRKKTTSLGIRNVNSRIKMKYSDHFGLRYSKGEAGNTVATVTVPFIS